MEHAMPYSFSNEIDRFLAIIKPWGRMNGKVAFPHEHDLYDSRWCSSDKNVINWFKRCVDTIFDGNVNCCAVSDLMLASKQRDNLQYVPDQRMIRFFQGMCLLR